MAECIRTQGRIVFIDDPANSLDLRIFKQKSVTLSWEFMYTRSMFKTEDMRKQGELLSMDFGKSQALITTLRELLESGLQLERALPAFTSNVAGLLRFHNKGRIAEGSDADLIVLDDNHEVTDVMANGKWHQMDKKQIVYGIFEEGIN